LAVLTAATPDSAENPGEQLFWWRNLATDISGRCFRLSVCGFVIIPRRLAF
jgi:hypothetical protein